MWHVHNEYGTTCHCDLTRAGVPGLAARPGTATWTGSTRPGPPRSGASATPTGRRSGRRGATQYLPNPAQVLDFRRFTSDELLAAYVEQRDILRAATPGVPVTTNFVLGDWVPVDHARWSREVDLVAIDHYPSDPGPGRGGADRVRGRPGPGLGPAGAAGRTGC